MKKVMFTFVATLAFGLFASANTIDVETDKTVKFEYNDSSIAEPDEASCSAAAMSFGDAVEATGASSQDVYNATLFSYNLCMRGWSWTFVTLR